MITIKGKLLHINVPGGETTGWAIDLDTELMLDSGESVDSIEIDPLNKRIDLFEGAHVEVAGEIVWRYGTERGEYPVVEILTIREVD